jgi:hypothetical protein
MMVEQLIRGRIAEGSRGNISAQAINDVARSIIIEDLLQSLDKDMAERVVGPLDIVGPAIDGNFCIISFFPEDCKETLRRLREVFRGKYSDQVEIINSSLVRGTTDGKPRIDCGL